NETAKTIVKRIVEAHLATFKRFSISYDLLVYEHDIVNNQLWDKLFEELKSKRLIVQPRSGDNKGAWIVKFGQTDREDKVLVRSNGLPTYTAKDIAYQLWKFDRSVMPGYERKFMDVDRVINVIDNRQEYPQAIIKYVLEKLGYKKEAAGSYHLSYGVVKLSAGAMKALGETAGDKAVAYSMSGRAGIGVMVDDLFETAYQRQLREHSTKPEVAESIAAGSIRYYMLKPRPSREAIFDFDEAFRTDGNTGVYLQYAYARCHNILGKVPDWHPALKSPKVPDDLSPESTALIKILERYPEVLATAAEELDPSLISDYAFELATSLAQFYESNPVLQANEELKNFRLHLVATVRQILGNTLNLLGIPLLERI
ncbi:arginine--tRNA ligase, partial [candidate division Kazan bacterium RBG_13_50_9]